MHQKVYTPSQRRINIPEFLNCLMVLLPVSNVNSVLGASLINRGSVDSADM